MNLLFAGTPEFAAQALREILAGRHRVCAVLTQPDRPAGRGLAALSSPVKRLAEQHRLPLLQPATLKEAAIQDRLQEFAADAMVVAAYGLILPQAVLDLPRLGALNIHASLLPRWRGAAPIQRAILAGDRETGISIMKMDAGLDTGPVYRTEAVPIGDDDTAGTLHDRLATLGATLCVRSLDDLEDDAPVALPQDEATATYAAKIAKAEARLIWGEPAERVWRKVRAFNPTPGAVAGLRNTEIKIWRCRPASGEGAPGEVLAASERGIRIACGGGAVLVTELQRPGGNRLPAGDFLRGFPVATGERFLYPAPGAS